MEENQQSETPIICNNVIRGYLLETSKWGKFLAVIGFVGISLMILLGIFLMIGMSFLSELSSKSMPAGFFGLIYIIMAAIYYFPVNYLHKFSVLIKQSLNSNDELALTNGFENLKKMFKFMAILTIVVLSIYVLILLIAIPSLLFFQVSGIPR